MRERERERVNARGIPIGNLTSQIFSNIYLNELDRFVKHNLKIKHYLRYGDDFIILADNQSQLEAIRVRVIGFLAEILRLEVNAHNDIIVKAWQGLRFLGAGIYPHGRRLNRRNIRRIRRNLNLGNLSSYRGLAGQYEKQTCKEIDWRIIDLLNIFE